VTLEDLLPLYALQKNFELNELDSLPLSDLKSGWSAKPLVNSPQFTLATDSKFLYFRFIAPGAASFDPIPLGTFQERLWEKDVAELFIQLPDSESYLELNLSPSGAWWLAKFSNYRQPDHSSNFSSNELAKLDVAVDAKVEAARWQVSIAVPLAEIGLTFDVLQNSSANICAILGSQERQYLSFTAGNSLKPDFHHAQLFKRLSVLAYP